jgi:hypothetical protein
VRCQVLSAPVKRLFGGLIVVLLARPGRPTTKGTALMNTTHYRSAWGIALASVALTVTTACGTEIATEPTDLGGADQEQRSPAPRDPCFGSADFAERCGEAGTQDDGQGGSARPGRLPDAWS